MSIWLFHILHILWISTGKEKNNCHSQRLDKMPFNCWYDWPFTQRSELSLSQPWRSLPGVNGTRPTIGRVIGSIVQWLIRCFRTFLSSRRTWYWWAFSFIYLFLQVNINCDERRLVLSMSILPAARKTFTLIWPFMWSYLQALMVSGLQPSPQHPPSTWLCSRLRPCWVQFSCSQHDSCYILFSVSFFFFFFYLSCCIVLFCGSPCQTVRAALLHSYFWFDIVSLFFVEGFYCWMVWLDVCRISSFLKSACTISHGVHCFEKWA